MNRLSEFPVAVFTSQARGTCSRSQTALRVPRTVQGVCVESCLDADEEGSDSVNTVVKRNVVRWKLAR